MSFLFYYFLGTQSCVEQFLWFVLWTKYTTVKGWWGREFYVHTTASYWHGCLQVVGYIWIPIPCIKQLARNIFIAMGSSVPSELAFSESGQLVTPQHARRSNDNIEMLMKISAWKELERWTCKYISFFINTCYQHFNF